MKIYFAGSITGGRQNVNVYEVLVEQLSKYGDVVTKHIGSKSLGPLGEVSHRDKDVYKRNQQWLKDSDAVIAEVTSPSLGVGYELAKAEIWKIPTLCLYRPTDGKRLSRMITGGKHFNVCYYQNSKDLPRILENFFRKLKLSI